MRKPKGDYGYISSQKKTYFLLMIIGLIVIVTIYCIDRFVLTKGNVLLLFVVLLALPEAQIIVRYILYKQYKDGKEEVYRKFEKISNELVCLGSIAVIRGKKTLLYEITVMSEKEIILLINSNKTRKEAFDYLELIEKLIRSRGYKAQVKIFTDAEEMYKYVTTHLSTILKNNNVDNQIALANMLLDNSI